MTDSNLDRLSQGVYRDKTTKKLVYIPKPGHVISGKPKTGSKKDDSQRKKAVRGKEVSVRQSASDGQVIYGEMKVGGVYSFMQTNSDQRAYHRSGEDNSQIVYIAREAGSNGNAISVSIDCVGTYGTIYIDVIDGTELYIRVKSTAGVSESTANQVISAIRANATANALVQVHQGEGSGAGLVQPEATEFLQGGGGNVMNQVVTIACHEINSVQKLYLDGKEVTFGATPDSRWATGDFANRVFMAVNLGYNSQTVQPDLQGQVGSDTWTDDHRQRGCALAYIITKWSASLFPNGLPEISFLVRGAPCYDFRDSATKWTQNPALIIADFLISSKYGLSVPVGDIDTASFNAAANICEESISLVSGGTESRYECNGVFDTSQSPEQVLEELLASCAGDLVYFGGKWYLYVGAWRAPVETLGEDDLRETLQIRTLVPRRDRFNSVKGSHVSKFADYNETDYPAVTNSTYQSQDGGVLWLNLNHNFVTSPYQAQRLAKIELERVRQGIEVVASFSTKAINLAPCDIIYLNHNKFGWVNKTFEVRDMEISDSTDEGMKIQLSLIETASGIYDWSLEETTVDLSPNTTLSDPTIALPPEDLVLSSGTSELYLRGDGTVFTRIKVAWTIPNDIFVIEGGHFEINYKQSSAPDWSSATPVRGDSSNTHILDVQDGVEYDVRIRSVNSVGVASDWVEELNYTIVGKTEKPNDVQNFTGTLDSFGITLSWNRVSDLDVSDYEIRIGVDFDSGALVHSVKGTSYRIEIRTAGNYTYWIKARDTSLNYSSNASSTTIEIPGPGTPAASHSIINADALVSWDTPTSFFGIEDYEVRYGSSWATGIYVATIKGNSLKFRVDWVGSRTFFVAARDVASNQGTPGTVVVTVQAPGAVQGLSSEAVDNNVLLRWSAPSTGTLPIDYYKILKGDVYGSATEIGRVSGTFSAYLEITGGTYTYWIVAVDTAGNLGTEQAATAIVNDPPDYVILADNDLISTEWRLVNMVEELGILYGPCSAGESWEAHFLANGWTSIQDAIDDGNTFFLEPNTTVCYCEHIKDFGTDLPPGIVKLGYLKTDISGSPVVTTTIAHSTDGVTYTELSGPQAYVGDPFRYVKSRIIYGSITYEPGEAIGILGVTGA